MQLSNIPGKLVLPFANGGGKSTIPVASQIGITAGAASLTDGFPPLTRTPIAAGGVPPSGLDMNGILYEMSAIIRWANAGGGYPFDGTFAADTNVGGYPKGARIMRTDGTGYWFNTVENNVTDPEGAGAAAAGWVPDYTNGAASVPMASASVTLTPSQYGKPVIVITGTLTANLNLIFPAIVGEWSILNNTTGGYTVTGKTATGVGVPLQPVDRIVCDGTDMHSNSAQLMAAIGAGLVGFSQASTYPQGSVGLSLKGVVSVKDAPYNAKGDGTTDDTTAIQAAINAVVASGGGEVYFPRGTYKITTALVMDTGSYLVGIALRGTGRNSIISQTGVGEDAIKFSTTQFLQNSYIRDMQINTSATSGHVINIVYGCTCCYFDNLELNVGNTGKSIFYADFTTFGGGIYDVKWRGGSWYCQAGATVPGFRVIAKGTIFNENVFENLRLYNATGAQFFKITTVTTGSVWLTNNTWKNINFEVCKGGGFYVDSLNSCKFENISFWDAGGAYTGNLMDFQAGAGYETSACVIINVGRRGDTLTAGIRDINLASGQDTVIINAYTQAGDSPSYDFHSKRVTLIGRLHNLLNASNVLSILPDISKIPLLYSNDVYGDTLHVGGNSVAESGRILYASGYLQIISLANSSALILECKTVGGASQKIIFDSGAFWPLTDNAVSLGTTGQRWTQLFAATATINTSDENEKQQIAAIPAKVLNAWGKVNYCQFKFNDAVEQRGKAARLHIGVIAQKVKAAFESEGIDPFAYGILCHDEWDAADAVLDESGVEIIPAREKGSRYGVRYEEALALECAYLRSKVGV